MKQLVWMCVAALCAGTAFGQAQPTAGAKDAIFVGTLKVAPAILDAAQASGSAAALEQFSAALDAALLSALADTQVFQIVDRARLADVQAEQARVDAIAREQSAADAQATTTVAGGLGRQASNSYIRLEGMPNESLTIGGADGQDANLINVIQQEVE